MLVMCVMQVVVVFCLWASNVSRAYVFQASGPSDGGDSPQPHTKGKNSQVEQELWWILKDRIKSS